MEPISGTSKQDARCLEHDALLRRITELEHERASLHERLQQLASQVDGTQPSADNPPLSDSNAERFRIMFEKHNALMLLIDPNSGAIIDANLAAQQFYGYPLTIFRTLFIQDINALAPEVVAALRVQAARESLNSFVFPHRLSSGELRTVEVHSCPIRFDGQLILFSIIHDITERKRAEDALRATKEAIELERNLLDAVMNGAQNIHLVYLNRQFEFVRVNQTYASGCGYRPEQMIGRKHFELYPDPEIEAIFVQVRDSGIPFETKDRAFTYPDQPQRGLTYWDWTLMPVKGADGKVIGLVFSLVETTQRKHDEEARAKLEEQLHHAQKMEAVGRLAGGVAHDFNNILGGVLSGLSLLLHELGEHAEKHRADILELKDLVKRGADLAKQLLGFSRRGKYLVQPLELAQIARKTSQMFARTRRDVCLHLDFAPDLRRVCMDHTQLEQVLLNLFLNAGQAMPSGGHLHLRAANVALGPEQAALHSVEAGGYVELVVADSGVGMDAATKARIFEPFFTAWCQAQGTGLGLASVYGIIKNHGGNIVVESELGHGTSFRILLPATDRVPTENTRKALPQRALSGKLLLVDDEALLLASAAKLLRSVGFEVLTASGGVEAVELMREHASSIALVILDLTMPGMSGAQTFDAIRAIAPEVQVLLASGFSIDGQARELIARGCCGFLQKPFELEELLDKLRSLR